jgi:hypothetical protein
MSTVASDQRDSRQDFLVRRYTDDAGAALLSGVQALVRLPLVQMRLDEEAGRRTACLISGYEGSPLAGYDIELAKARRLLDTHRVVFQPGLNEELPATAISGCQLVGLLGDGWRLCNVSAAIEKDSDTFVGRAIVTVNIEPAPGV